MDRAKNDIEVPMEWNDNTDLNVIELSDSQLALIGGGIGDPIVH